MINVIVLNSPSMAVSLKNHPNHVMIDETGFHAYALVFGLVLCITDGTTNFREKTEAETIEFITDVIKTRIQNY